MEPPEKERSPGQAFGVAVDAAFPLPRLPHGEAGRLPRVRLEQADGAALKAAWPNTGTREVLRRTLPNGQLVMIVEQHPEAGYSVRAPRHGRHLISRDGSAVRSALPRVAAWRWERLLYAQVLPLASALRGRELLHASAVSIGGQVIAFVGNSGAGKSTVAAHLADGDATLVTDDVLALELTGGCVLAHPGSRLVGLDPQVLASLGSPAFGLRLGQAEKTYLDVTVAADAEPLAAVYLLGIGHGNSAEIARSATAAGLLGAGFLAYLDDPEHLVRHLDICASIARDVPTYDVLAPRTGGAASLAADIREHARENAL